MENKIFLDFDETLGHVLYASSEKHADDLLYDYGEHFVGEKFQIRHDGWYVGFKRAWADELIQFCKQLVGPESVFILTTGIQDYIRWCNIKLNLGFDPNTNIFGREDIRINKPHPKFIDTFNVLVDNLSYRDHVYPPYSKVNFLNGLPRSQYVKVDEFNVWIAPLDDDSEYFESVKNDIVKVMNPLIKTEL